MNKILDFLWDNKDILIPTTIPEHGYKKLKKIHRQQRVKKGLNADKPKKKLQVLK